jgi:hypothetical protein
LRTTMSNGREVQGVIAMPQGTQVPVAYGRLCRPVFDVGPVLVRFGIRDIWVTGGTHDGVFG